MVDPKIKMVLECYDEAKSAWQEWFDECTEDFKFYMSDQWNAEALKMAKDKGAPTLNINYIKKTVDVVSGFERQNKGDIKVFPIEGSDEYISEIEEINSLHHEWYNISSPQLKLDTVKNELLTLCKVTKIFGLDDTEIIHILENRQIPYYKIHQRIFFRKSEFEKFFQKNGGTKKRP